MGFTCWLDSDGVLCNFDAHVMSLSGGVHPRIMGDALLWELVEKTPDFWLTMPLMDGAHDLVEAARPFNVEILTGCPKTGFDRAVEHKRIKLAEYFPGVPVNTCLSRDKPTFMKSKDDILIDDFVVNIRRWEKAGGTAILYRNANQAIEKLNRIVAERVTRAAAMVTP